MTMNTDRVWLIALSGSADTIPPHLGPYDPDDHTAIHDGVQRLRAATAHDDSTDIYTVTAPDPFIAVGLLLVSGVIDVGISLTQLGQQAVERVTCAYTR